MDSFAEYILNEPDLASKMEIVYYLSKKTNIFFDKTVIFKTEILRLFLNYSKIEVDNNLILTASLLCNCKKIDNAQDLDRVHTYAKDGADYLSTLGFGKRFCKICEQINRYSGSNPREKESDILELVDQFGGMLLDRPERIGFKPDEALVLLEHRNLKDLYNRYLTVFIDFVNYMETIQIHSLVNMTAFRRLSKILYESDGIANYIKNIIWEYEPQVDKLINENLSHEILENVENPNRPLFSQETTKKIMSHLESLKNGVESNQ